MKKVDASLLRILEETIPFRFLSRYERESLASDLTYRHVDAGEEVFRNEEETREVYLLLDGLVETVDTSVEPPVRVNQISAGRYFGERASLFSSPRQHTVRAVDPSKLYEISGERFLRLVRESPAFAQSLGAVLREKQGIFSAFERFSAEVAQSISLGYLDIRRLLPLYRALEPVLHPGAVDTDPDFEALRYAAARLPDNITGTFVYLVTDELPFEYLHADELFARVPTSARRRNVWEMLPGQNMVLMRHGVSDLLDLVTCLCIYAVEARKIRKLISEPQTLTQLGELSGSIDGRRPRDLLAGLSLPDNEIEGLLSVWPEKVVERLNQIVRHREAISLDIRRQTNNYDSLRTDLWTRQIGAATREFLGYDPSDLPSDYTVHIVSSNTHSVTNCLDPDLSERAADILEWARATGNPEYSGEWRNQRDLVYVASREYLTEIAGGASLENDRGSGWIYRLRETVSTGIQVQLISLGRLAGFAVDPGIGPLPRDSRALIVNIDYAFGEQAEEIIRNLIMLFGRNLASINVLGKAGALVGKRGDILAPTAFIEQTSDRFYPVANAGGEGLAQLAEADTACRTHIGPLLTVSGTLIQNNMMLNFYRHIWGCVGLEMEGTHYYRQILEFQQLGVIPSRIPLRFLYYVSDLPLDRKAALSVHLSPSEGVPPLYAITREILHEINQQEQNLS